MRKIAAITSIVVGIIMAIAGVVTWVVVSTTLADQKITVSDDANCAAGDGVNGPISAYCQADIIDHHTQDITGGLTYAELPQDDPNRSVRSCRDEVAHADERASVGRTLRPGAALPLAMSWR